LGKEYEARRALDVYLGEQRRVLEECARALKPSGSLFWQVGAFSDRGRIIPLDVRFFPLLEDLALIPRNRIVWIRQHGLHASRKFSYRHETILWFTKTDDYKFFLDRVRVPQKYRDKKAYRGPRKGELSCNPAGKNPGDIWAFRNVKHNHDERTDHPCQFPEDLVARIVLATTDKGDVVLDPYMGTGTVAVVAQDLERHFYGAEIEKRYIEIAARRLEGTPGDGGRFPNLKSLRRYIERTGEPYSKYRFDVQIGECASPAASAKIFPESYHLEETVSRIAFEEQSWTVAKEPAPGSPTHAARQHHALQESLFAQSD
jgi:adenine-specific DNA-methyltransferase